MIGGAKPPWNLLISIANDSIFIESAIAYSKLTTETLEKGLKYVRS